MTIKRQKLPTFPGAELHTVWIVLFPGFQLLDATGPAQVFSCANDALVEQGQACLYRLKLLSSMGGNVASCSGIELATQVLPSRLAGGTLIVVGGTGTPKAMHDAALVSWLARVAPAVERCASVCSGAFLLAQAGLLNGKRATTHWQDAVKLRQRFPQVQVDEDAIFVCDGNTYSSAGVTAGIDLSLHLVEQNLSRRVALGIAQRLVLPLIRSGGQRQFSPSLLAQQHLATQGDGSVTLALIQWLQTRLVQPLTVLAMAQAMCMSVRSLHRHVQAESGLTPAALLERLRVDAACRLLESGHGSIKTVTRRCGFGSEASLRRSFRAALGVMPSDYRAKFGRS